MNLKKFNVAKRHWGAAIRAAALVGSAPVAAASVAAGAHLEGPLSDEALAELKEAFDALDLDRTGKVTLAELQATMGALGHADEAKAVFDRCDTHHDGFITFEEFVAAVGYGPRPARVASTPRPVDLDRPRGEDAAAAFVTDPVSVTGPIYDNSTAALQRAFAIFDLDGSGTISFDEFATIMDRLHLLPRGDDAKARKAVREMFEIADLDHTGTISFDEFRMMFHQRAAAAPPPRAMSHVQPPRPNFHPKHHTTKLLTAAFIK